MMNGYYGSGGMGWGGWLAMALVMVAFWGLVVYVVVALFRGNGSTSSPSVRAGDPTDARRILDERLARGDIQVEEYQARKDALAHRTRI